MDDGVLLTRWREGDRDSGDILVSRYLDPVVRFFRFKLGDDIQDIVQRTFLDLLESSERYDDSRPLKPYLFAIAKRRLIDELRRRYQAPKFDPARSSLAALDPTPSQVAARSEESRLLRRALRRVSLEHQIVLELFYWEAMRGADIAIALGVSAHTVRSRLARAKAAVRTQIEALADSPQLSASTLAGLDGGTAWALDTD